MACRNYTLHLIAQALRRITIFLRFKVYAGIHETSMRQKDIYIYIYWRESDLRSKNNYQFFYALIMCMFLSANGQDIATAY